MQEETEEKQNHELELEKERLKANAGVEKNAKQNPDEKRKANFVSMNMRSTIVNTRAGEQLFHREDKR